MNKKVDYFIRFATQSDMKFIITLCQAHAHYEQAEYDPSGKIDLLATALFGDQPKLFCLVVELDNKLMGYATYMLQYSTWDASEYVYMDCLYIEEAYRGFGIGEALVEKIKKEASRLQCKHIQWQTPDFNTRAIKFYNRIGATSKTKERFFLITN